MVNYYAYYRVPNMEGGIADTISKQKALVYYWAAKERKELYREFVELSYPDDPKIEDRPILLNAIDAVRNDPDGVLIVAELDLLADTIKEKLEIFNSVGERLKSCDMPVISKFQIMFMHEYSATMEENKSVISVTHDDLMEEVKTYTRSRKKKTGKVVPNT